MAEVNREFGVVGLGRMGANISLQALEKGMRVVGFDMKGAPEELREAGMVEVDSHDGFRKQLSPAEVLRCWRHGSVIRSWLIDLMEEAYRSQAGLDTIPAYVEDTGEVNWLVNDALHMEVPVPVISLAVMQLFASRDRKKNWARAIAMMRHGFGGHPYGPDESIIRERREGRIGEFPRDWSIPE